jgi:coproporphyrinogen III oxidase
VVVVNRESLEAWFRRFQSGFVEGLERFDGGSRFAANRWDRPGGGGGDTRVLTEGRHIEKAAVNFSAVWGTTSAAETPGGRFYATGVSIIVHPRNPHAPTFHANLRYFDTDPGAWFGGGADLTPHYLYEEDARHFHGVLAAVCRRHPVADHAGWKRECDDYFFLSHRGERRGVGGLFYDRLDTRLDEVWALTCDLGDHLLDAYLPILQRRVDIPYGPAEIEWQEVRRGRYAEFNLVWDRGTRFGLETGGRTESVLASLPPRARWVYDHTPATGSREAELLDLVRSPPRDWL